MTNELSSMYDVGVMSPVTNEEVKRKYKAAIAQFFLHNRRRNSASKSSIRRFVITEKAPTRTFSWLKAATTGVYPTVSQCEIGS